jgi:hypothetical protein
MNADKADQFKKLYPCSTMAEKPFLKPRPSHLFPTRLVARTARIECDQSGSSRIGLE